MIDFNNLPAEVAQISEKLDFVLETLSKLAPQQTKKRLNIKEASEYTGYSVNTLYGKVNREEIPFYKMGAKLFFDPEALDKWIDANK